MLKIPNKLLYSSIGIVVGCAITIYVVATNAANIRTISSTSGSEAEPSKIVASDEVSTITSSNASSENEINSQTKSASSSAESKSEIDKQTDSAVSRIQKATDDGVSRIIAAASEAAQEVKQSMSSTSGPTVKCATNKLIGKMGRTRADGTEATWDVGCDNSLSEVDEANKCIIINYGGHFNGDWSKTSELKSYGFKIKNASGNEINFDQEDFCRMKVPYQNLSDVSELYFTYQDQSIKITVG